MCPGHERVPAMSVSHVCDDDDNDDDDDYDNDDDNDEQLLDYW